MGLEKFLPPTQPLPIFAAKSYGDFISGIGTLHWRAWCGVGALHSQDMPPEFLSSMHGCGISLFHVSVPPTSLDGCGFFNSVVVRLPFNSISAGSE